VWLALDEPQLTIEAWVEALRRAGPEAVPYYDQMLNAGWPRLGVRAGLGQIAQSDPRLLLAYLDRTSGLEFDLIVARLLERDPALATLTPEQRKRFFEVWSRRGDREQLISTVVAHPEWQAEAWLAVAHYYATKKDFERAWRFVARYGPVPVLPKLGVGRSLTELERNVHLRPEDFQEGLALYAAQRQQRQNDEALATLRAVGKVRGRPDYVPYLEAVLWAEKEEWEKAWEAWARYHATVKGG
jgi:hypothetical protein